MRRSLALVAVLALVATTAASAALGPPAGGGVGWQPGVRAAKRYAQRRAGEIGFAVIGLDGRQHGLHRHLTAPAASVFKVMLLAAYLRRPAVRHRPLDRGDRRLLGPMIRVSDSVAATRARDIVGVRAIERLAHGDRMHAFRY